jgi:glutaredoxin
MKKILLLLFILILPVLVFAQDAGKKKAYFFYLDTCPHCHNVDNYFQSNGIYDKYDISKMDASNPFNANLLEKFYAASGDPNGGGVPAVAFADKFMVGDQPIINNFVKEIETSDNANVLPDPSKITADSNAEAQDSSNQSNSDEPATPNGNNKNYFPAILTALIVIVGGILIFINRKKTN